MTPVPVKFDIVEVEKKAIGVLTIYKSLQVPHQMLQNGCFYVRRGSTTDITTRDEIARMLQENGMLSFEVIPCRNATEKDYHFGIGLSKVKDCFKEKGEIKIENDILSGLFKVSMPGPEKYQEVE